MYEFTFPSSNCSRQSRRFSRQFTCILPPIAAASRSSQESKAFGLYSIIPLNPLVACASSRILCRICCLVTTVMMRACRIALFWRKSRRLGSLVRPDNDDWEFSRFLFCPSEVHNPRFEIPNYIVIISANKSSSNIVYKSIFIFQSRALGCN